MIPRPHTARDEELMTILGPGDAVLIDDPDYSAALCARAVQNGHEFTSRLIGYNSSRLVHLLAKPTPNSHQTGTAS